jgi:hypothetical protein
MGKLACGISFLQVEWFDMVIVAVRVPYVWSIIFMLCITVLQEKGIEELLLIWSMMVSEILATV